MPFPTLYNSPLINFTTADATEVADLIRGSLETHGAFSVTLPIDQAAAFRAAAKSASADVGFPTKARTFKVAHLTTQHRFGIVEDIRDHDEIPDEVHDARRHAYGEVSNPLIEAALRRPDATQSGPSALPAFIEP